MRLAEMIEESRREPELWRYADLSFLKEIQTQAPVVTCEQLGPLPEAYASHRIVFVNGTFCPTHSRIDGLPEGVLQRAEDGRYLIVLDARTCLAVTPIEVLYVSAGDGPPQEHACRCGVNLGESGRLTLIERHLSIGNAQKFQAMEAEIFLGKQAKLVHAKIVHGDDNLIHFTRSNLHVSAGAFFDRVSIALGGRFSHCEMNISLDGEFAEVRLHTAILMRGKNQAHFVSSIRHNTPLCTSMQECRGVLEDRAKGSFLGMAYVAPGAQKTDAYQLCRALLLSPQAEMNVKPALEIYADDVKCSHGAAIGDLDENALFYLRSRGISEKEARAMLVHAFVSELLDKTQSMDIVRAMRKEVETWLD